MIKANKTISQVSKEAQQLLPELVPATLADDHPILRLITDKSDNSTATSGIITHPRALRWWRYPLDNGTTTVLLMNIDEQHRHINRQQAFIGQISHELRTPLTALVAHLEIIRNPSINDALRKSSLDTLHHETQRLVRLVRDLLELHRLEVVADLLLQPTDVILIAEDAIAQSFPQAEARKIRLTLDAAIALPLALAHPDRLKQIFLNLLDNAIKYCQPNNTIQVRLSKMINGIQCSVIDNGPGISSTDLPHVHEPLYRGKTSIDGNGIGLAIVHELVHQHHSFLTIESSTVANRSGTNFSWTLSFAGGENNS